MLAFQIYIAYVHDGKKWAVSFYSVPKEDESMMVDVSEIAKKHGGGGHTHAAGFVCDKLPWEKEGVSDVQENS